MNFQNSVRPGPAVPSINSSSGSSIKTHLSDSMSCRFFDSSAMRHHPVFLSIPSTFAASLPQGRETSELLQAEISRAQSLVALIFPSPEFFAIAAAIDDSTGRNQMTALVDEYLSTLESARIAAADPLALQSLPSGAFGGAYASGATLVRNAAELTGQLSETERNLLQGYLRFRIVELSANVSLSKRYPHTLAH